MSGREPADPFIANAEASKQVGPQTARDPCYTPELASGKSYTGFESLPRLVLPTRVLAAPAPRERYWAGDVAGERGDRAAAL